MIVLLIFGLISFTLSTTTLALALWLIGEDGTDPFKTDGFGPTITKCAAICAVTTVLSFFPFGGLLGTIIWFVAVMALFEKTFLGALLIAICGAVLTWLIAFLILSGLEGILGAN